MREILFRCSSIGKLMAEPKTKAEGPLSVGAKTYIRELAQQEIFGVEFEFSSKETQKGLEVEDDSIALLNRVRGLALVKNTERKTNGLITGECDLFDVQRRRGHDLEVFVVGQDLPRVDEGLRGQALRVADARLHVAVGRRRVGGELRPCGHA
ncbi:hypothetical protein [Delftia sp.]|uniref:hypothetical protein n=1 Tax=Delftia sp. TaxID=1886637 RepID=UPI00259C7C23|nr:hypothetical protein [Delftia sp.]